MSATTRTVLLWIGRILMALLFLAAGSQKLIGAQREVAQFQMIGLGQGFRYLTGMLEVGGALALLWPRTSFYAALLLTCVMAGAFCAQAFALHGDVVHTIVIGAITALLAFFQRPAGFRRAAPALG